MEIILNPSVRAVTGLTLPPVLISPEDHLDVLVNKWITYIILNGVLGTVLSILLATLFYYGYEKPMTSFVKRMIDSQLTTNSSLKNKKE